MSEELNNQLRCRPGDLARVIFSNDSLLLGRVVLIEKWGRNQRWDVTLLGAPTFGFEFETGRPLITNKTAFRDSSLRPLNLPRRPPGEELILLDPPVRGMFGSGAR